MVSKFSVYLNQKAVVDGFSQILNTSICIERQVQTFPKNPF